MSRDIAQVAQDLLPASPDFEQQLIKAIPDLRRMASQYTHGQPCYGKDDLVQETLVRALAAHASFEPGTNFKMWLAAIMRNFFLNQVRKQKREVQGGEEFWEFAFRNMMLHATPELKIDLEKVLAEIPETKKELLYNILLDGSHAETAAKMKVEEGEIKSRIFRLRKLLKEQLEAPSESRKTGRVERLNRRLNSA